MSYKKVQAAREFDHWSQGYDRCILQRLLFGPSHRAIIARVTARFCERPLAILDVGCGTGVFASRSGRLRRGPRSGESTLSPRCWPRESYYEDDTAAISAGDVFTVAVVGQNLYLYQNGVLLTNPSTIGTGPTSGVAGLFALARVAASDVGWSNFIIGSARNMSNPTSACRTWKNNEDGKDFLALYDKQTGFVGGIDNTGTGWGGLAGGVPQFASYTFYVSGGTVYARNNNTGAVDYSGTDAAVVINAVLNANATIGGTLYFKNGIYPINSRTLDTTSGIYYGIGLPYNDSTHGTNVQWLFIGESRTVWLGEGGSTAIQTNGVIFNVTAAALSGLGGTTYMAAIYQIEGEPRILK